MSAEVYYRKIRDILDEIHKTQTEKIVQAAECMAAAIAARRRVWLFGSGHSVIPVLDMFPRYGGFVGLYPLCDPRLMWFNVIGPGGARELLWLERQEGYVEVFLRSYPLRQGDVMVVFSHGGLNAAPLDAALEARKRGLTVISVSSHANLAVAARAHSSGKALAEAADIAIDNCVPPEDALVDVGARQKVAAGSTVAAVFIAMSLVAETAARLAARGVHPPTFVSPNVPGIEPDHNQRVFEAFTAEYFRRE